MNLETLRDSFHVQSLLFRNIDNIIHSDNFAIAFHSADEKEKGNVQKQIFLLNKDYLKLFIISELDNLTPFHKMGIRKLREIGRNLRIAKYFILNKSTLIEEIKNVAERLKKDGR